MNKLLRLYLCILSVIVYVDSKHKTICEPNEFKCPSGECVMKIYRCDGVDDCKDGHDEFNCQSDVVKNNIVDGSVSRTVLPDGGCEPDEFKCSSGNQCIPLAYQCDREIDCLDRSDEIGCSQPI